MPVPGYLSNPALTDDPAQEPASKSASAAVLLTGGTTGLTDMLTSEAQRGLTHAGEGLGLLPQPKTLSPQDATAQYGLDGALTFDRPVSESEAAWRSDVKRDELFRSSILARDDRGPLSTIALSLGSTVVDPVNLSLNFMPVGWLGRIGLAGEAATRGGTIVARMARGAAEAETFTTAASGATYGLAKDEGRDYSAGDVATDLTAGALFGGVLGGLHGVVAPLHAAAPRVSPRFRPGSDAPMDFASRLQTLGEKSRQDQVSPKGARGVMQVMPGTARDAAAMLGEPFDEALYNDTGAAGEAYSKRLGTTYSNAMLTRYGGDEVLGSAAYNAGPARVDKWIKAYGDPRTGAISHADWLRMIPIKETRDYVARVTGGHPGGSSIQLAALDPAAGGDAGGSSLPRVAAELEPDARGGALAKAIDDLADDRPVDLGDHIDREIAVGQGARPELDDGATGQPVAYRPFRDDTAVTPRGTEIGVRYGLVEADHLVTSHDDDLVRNMAYPEALQPRDRTRAGYAADQARLRSQFNPRLVMDSPDAAGGAPIVGPDGVVESGNGRSILLRREARAGSDLYGRYRTALDAAGYDTTGMDKPILARIRTQPMDGQTRVRLTREMNAQGVQAYSVAEQAAEDARGLSDDDWALHQGGDVTSAANRPFARKFVEKLGAGRENDLIDAGTRSLSKAGQQRIEAATLYKAYGDADLVRSLYETTDPNALAIGKGLSGAAPEWARMRAMAARGELAAGVDVSDHLTSAAAFVRWARESGQDVATLVENRLGQHELFGGEALSPQTEAFLRIFFRDEGFRKPRGADSIAAALRDYARMAGETTAAPGLFGADHDVNAQDLLVHLADKLRGEARDVPDPRADLLSQPVEPRVPEPLWGPGEQPHGGGLREEGGGGAAGKGAGGLEPAGGGESLENIESRWTSKGVQLVLSEARGDITLAKIVVPKDERNSGIGSQVMADITAYADATGKRLLLSPSKEFGGAVGRLKEFYSRFGFKPNTGRSRDLSISETMLRDPKRVKAAPDMGAGQEAAKAAPPEPFAADPELKLIHEDSAALASDLDALVRTGLLTAAERDAALKPEGVDARTLADAYMAAAECMLGGEDA